MTQIKYELHYANLDSEEIINYVLYEGNELNAFLISESNTECVFVVSLFDEVYVTDHILCVLQFIDSFKLPREDNLTFDVNLFIQEYASFEEAYKVALDMQEIKPLCYA